MTQNTAASVPDNMPVPGMTPAAATPVQGATPHRIAICIECGSHFQTPVNPQPTGDPAAGLHCPACVEWKRLLGQRDSYARSVRGTRGGRP